MRGLKIFVAWIVSILVCYVIVECIVYPIGIKNSNDKEKLPKIKSIFEGIAQNKSLPIDFSYNVDCGKTSRQYIYINTKDDYNNEMLKYINQRNIDYEVRFCEGESHIITSYIKSGLKSRYELSYDKDNDFIYCKIYFPYHKIEVKIYEYTNDNYILNVECFNSKEAINKLAISFMTIISVIHFLIYLQRMN